MFIEALFAAAMVASASLVGVLFFGNSQKLIGVQRFVIPVAVGVFLSLIFFELIPETLSLQPEWGGVMVVLGFVAFYILSSILHRRYHVLGSEDCGRKEAATLLLIGDTIHNAADGVVLGGAFLIDPALGTATAIGLVLHEIPQEIVEFGVLIRAGYTRLQAALCNLLSASSVIVGTAFILVVAEQAEHFTWVLTGIAAGNLLYIAIGDLLPRIHGSLKNYISVWHSAGAIMFGFVFMTAVLVWTHSTFGHGHAYDDMHDHDDEVAEMHQHDE